MKSLSLLVAAALGLAGAVASAQSQSTDGTTSGSSASPSSPVTGGMPSDYTTSGSTAGPSGSSTAGAATSGAQTPTSPATATSSSASTTASTPIVVENKVDLRTEPSAPEDLRAARKEAVNALHWAKTEGCRSEPSPRDCVRQAQEDYRAALGRLGSDASMRSTTSASGTSAAPGTEGRAPRSDRR